MLVPEGEIFVNIILDLDNKLLTEPVIFCPTVTDKNELVYELKNLVSEQLIQMVSKSITDEILSDELKKSLDLI